MDDKTAYSAHRLMNAEIRSTEEAREMMKPRRRGLYLRFGKRILDLLISTSALLIGSPVYALLAILVKINIGSPVFYTQTRAGLGGRPFKIYKFRTMTNKRDESGVLLPEDQRITGFGRFLRVTSLDEIPQFFNVFRGDMSIIGPRPMQMSYLLMYSPKHLTRQTVMPGLDCPPVGNNGYARTYQEMLENDVCYVENTGFLTDMKQIVRLISAVVRRKNSHDKKGSISLSLVGYDADGVAVGDLLTTGERAYYAYKEAEVTEQMTEPREEPRLEARKEYRRA